MATEQSYYGIGVSSGVAIGTAHLFKQETTAVPQRTIAAEQVEPEYARFLEALQASREQVVSVRKRVAGEVGEEQAKIFDFQIRDFSAYAVALHGKSSSTPAQQEWAIGAVRKPVVDQARADRVWEVVKAYDGAYEMRP